MFPSLWYLLFMHITSVIILQCVSFTNLKQKYEQHEKTIEKHWIRRVQRVDIHRETPPGLVASARGCTIGTEAPVALRQLQLQMSKPQVAILPEGSLDPNLAKVTTTFLKVLLDGYLAWIEMSFFLEKIGEKNMWDPEMTGG